MARMGMMGTTASLQQPLLTLTVSFNLERPPCPSAFFHAHQQWNMIDYGEALLGHV